MKRPQQKDFYSLLGVDPHASEDQIRDAYLARTRVIHPDRFDKDRQPQDWKKANEMLAELNEAYSTLRNPRGRQEYDAIHFGDQQHQHTAPNHQQTPPPSPASDLGQVTSGQVRYKNLPKAIQERLRKRQENRNEEQFQAELDSVLWNYAFIAILLCWFWYLFSEAEGPKWENSTLFWYASFTLAVGLLIGRNISTITRWTKSTLKSYFYVTPIYFVRTHYDTVTFWPIWTLKDIAVTHRHKGGSYQDSEVILKFEGNEESLSLSSKEQAEAMLTCVKAFDSRFRTELASGNRDYFRRHDDFFCVPRTAIQPTVSLSNGLRGVIYFSSLFLCGIGLVTAIVVNDDLSQGGWVRHSPPTTLAPAAPPRVARAAVPEQPLPSNGSVKSFTRAARVAPFEIKAAQDSHYLVKLADAISGADVLTVFVRSGTTVKIEVPLGTYDVRYASGEIWYGYEYLFGPDTAYSKANETFTFEVVENQVSGFTITLFKVKQGNLSTSSIKPTDF